MHLKCWRRDIPEKLIAIIKVTYNDAKYKISEDFNVQSGWHPATDIISSCYRRHSCMLPCPFLVPCLKSGDAVISTPSSNWNYYVIVFFLCCYIESELHYTQKLQTFINTCQRRIIGICWHVPILNEELSRRHRPATRKSHTNEGRQLHDYIMQLNPHSQGGQRVGHPKGTWRRTVEGECEYLGKL